MITPRGVGTLGPEARQGPNAMTFARGEAGFLVHRPSELGVVPTEAARAAQARGRSAGGRSCSPAAA